MTCLTSHIVVEENPTTKQFRILREDFDAEWQSRPSRTVAIAVGLTSEKEAWLWVEKMGCRSIDERNKFTDEPYKAAFKRFREENQI